MIAELPRPGSIWRYKSVHGGNQTRVIYSSDNDIIAHNCELGNAAPGLISWRGNFHEFQQIFVPGDPTQYPATAH